MKKILSFILIISLLISSATVAYAKQGDKAKQQKVEQKTEVQVTKQASVQQKKQTTTAATSTTTTTKATKKSDKKATKATKAANVIKQSFKIAGSPVIKYGKYKLPIRPITKGMGAAVDFNKDTAVLTVTKDTTTIVINFKDKTVTVNGVADTTSGIFTAKNDKKTTVLVQYIAEKLGLKATVTKDKVTVEDDLDNDDAAGSVSGGAISVVSGSAITTTTTTTVSGTTN